MKKKINIENYEAYLLDLSEGNLNEADRAELMLFLSGHPELDWDLDGLPFLEDEMAELDDTVKTALFRNEESGLSQKDHLLISSIEGTLSTSESNELGELLKQDQVLLKELAYYQKTILPKSEIIFEQKDDLIKKEGRLVYFWASTASIAAAILALFLFNLPEEEMYSPRGYGFVETTVADSKVGFSFEVSDEEKENGSAINGQKRSKKSKLQPVEVPSNQFAEEKEAKIKEGRIDQADPREENTPQLAEVQEEDQLKVEEPMPILDEVEIGKEEELADNTPKPKMVDTKESTPTKVFTPLEYAKKVVKEDVLNNKSLPKALIDEVADLTNDKVKLEKEKDSPQFALNIGKLKINKK